MEKKMLALKATYTDGKLTALDGTELPHGTQEVIVTFLEEPSEELSEEFKAELDRRTAAIDDGTAKLIPGEDVFRELRQKYS